MLLGAGHFRATVPTLHRSVRRMSHSRNARNRIDEAPTATQCERRLAAPAALWLNTAALPLRTRVSTRRRLATGGRTTQLLRRLANGDGTINPRIIACTRVFAIEFQVQTTTWDWDPCIACWLSHYGNEMLSTQPTTRFFRLRQANRIKDHFCTFHTHGKTSDYLITPMILCAQQLLETTATKCEYYLPTQLAHIVGVVVRPYSNCKLK